MNDEDKTKEELILELKKLKEEISFLKAHQNLRSLEFKENFLEREELFYTMFEKNKAVKLLIDPVSGAIINANSAASEFYGYTLETLKNMKIIDINTLTKEQVHEEMSSAFSEKRSYFVFKHKLESGEIKNVEVFSSPVLIDGRYLLFSIIIDITLRISAEEQLKKTNIELEKQKILLDQILATTTDHFIIFDSLGRFIYVNKAGLEAQGLTYEQVIGQTWRELEFPEETGKVFDKHLNDVFILGKSLCFEARFPSVDGMRDWDVTYKPLCDEAGDVINMVAIYRDITERKKFQEQITDSLNEKEVLLREVHHRVKNNLQVISSLLYLQTNSIEDKKTQGIMREIQTRVKSMSLVHERLYQSKTFSRIDFGIYLESLIDHIFLTYGVNRKDIKLNIFADNIHLNIDTAILCGLIINELISNSLKYAFPAEKNFSEKYISTFIELDKFNILSIRFSDNGIGLPESLDVQKADTLGLQLVNLLVEQLDGIIKSDNKTGASYNIDFPLKK